MDKCPDRFADKSAFRHVSIETFDQFKSAIETTSDGDKMCFSDFNVLADMDDGPIVINKTVHILCENYSCGIQGGGANAIFHVKGNGSAIIQGLTFIGVQQAMRFDNPNHNKVCYSSFLR